MVTTMVSMEAQIREIAAEILCVDEEALTPQALLIEDLGMDSLDRVELTMALEERLLDDEPIGEPVAEEWRTVQDVVDTVIEMAEKQSKVRK